MAARISEFQTIRSEGGLLPPDLLRRVIDPKEKLVGTAPTDYGLPEGERLNDVITQSWNRLRKHWQEFRAAASNLPAGEPGTSLTNDKWTLPLFRELGYGLLPTTVAPVIDGRTYAISRFFGSVPVHLVGFGVSLDRRTAGVRGAAAANPHGLVQEFLNRSSKHQWALVSNGLRLRLLRDNQALSRQSFLEFDLEAMFAGEVFSDFVLLWLMAHATRFLPREAERPDTCWLEDWTKITSEQGTRALGELRGGVERALQTLGEGFTSHAKNIALRDALRTGQLPIADFHGQLLRVVYRLIFLFVAEDRGIDGLPLLHPRDGSEAARLARERYAEHYGTVRLRELAAKIKGSRHGDLWRQLQLLVGALSGGGAFATAREHLALPTLGSLLWDFSSTTALNDAELTNHDFLEALRNLAFTRQDKMLRPVDYRNLGAEELGGVYESLLALTPQISADGARFTFAEFAGNERKTSGSYYTPDSLVQCLLDSALDPVVGEAIKGKTGTEAETAILALKICDPAVGSGHFLVGAAHRLARHVARVRALAQGESEPSPLLYQHALRDVIGRCLYGVDINPMAAELCRVSLWLEALQPGKPLSFLDHHIRVGNSLLGATPELIAEGIPDGAYQSIEGDDKEACKALKKLNKQEQGSLKHLFEAEHAEIREGLRKAAMALDDMADNSPEEIRAKADAFRHSGEDPSYQAATRLANLWCAAFVIKKEFAELDVSRREAIPLVDPDAPQSVQGSMFRRASAAALSGEAGPVRGRVRARAEVPVGITTRHLRDHRTLPAHLASSTATLAEQYGFFHWYLMFPEVFARGGFDCVLANPPWERVKLAEKEWFAERRPEITAAPNAAARKGLIKIMRNQDPALNLQFLEALRVAEGESHFIRHAGLYPDCGRGDVNLYAVFAERMRCVLDAAGRVGCILPTGIATDDTTKLFFQHVVESRSLFSLFDFENKGIFSGVHSSFKFCLFTYGSGLQVTADEAQFVFFAHAVEDLRKPDRRFTLSPEDFALLNPTTRTCPIFRSGRDAEITKSMYRVGVPLVHCMPPTGFFPKIDMSDEVHKFQKAHEFSGAQPRTFPYTRDGTAFIQLYESKLVWHFDHRFGTFDGCSQLDYENGNAKNLTDAEKADASCTCVPRYYVPQQLVHERYDYQERQHSQLLTVRRLTNATNERTAVFSFVPYAGCGNSMFVFDAPSTMHAVWLSACGNSLPFDYMSRNKLGGTNFLQFVIEQLAFIPFHELTIAKFGSHGSFLENWLLPRVLELTYTAWDMKPFAAACGWHGSPFRWDEERRLLIRCELDAAFFHLYFPDDPSGNWQVPERGPAADLARLKASFPTPRNAVGYIIDSFPIVRRKDEEKWGEYRIKRVILEIYDAMAESIRTGQPYQTRLDPSPAAPRCCHPTRTTAVLET